jgi:hypothetical protein
MQIIAPNHSAVILSVAALQAQRRISVSSALARQPIAQVRFAKSFLFFKRVQHCYAWFKSGKIFIYESPTCATK